MALQPVQLEASLAALPGVGGAGVGLRPGQSHRAPQCSAVALLKFLLICDQKIAFSFHPGGLQVM